ncbi:cysteine synthase family protein [bacterium]|nr:cysteine synthase family protein [bacterium]
MKKQATSPRETSPQDRPPLLREIGNTPLIPLKTESEATILLKLEYLNPGGSIKDRAALFMIEDAERRGLLQPGGTIVEGSSGNQGIALAMIGAVKGYRVIIVVPNHTSTEKKAALRAYGAELHIAPDAATHDDPSSYSETAKRLAREIPGAFMPNQYYNVKNAEAHYTSTGPEIWEQTGGKITHFFSGMGSCGTISGVGRFLKEQNPTITVIGADSAHSLLSAETPRSYITEGIGVDVISDVLNRTVIDEVSAIYDEEAFHFAREYAKKGFLVGPSSGAVLCTLERWITETNGRTLTAGDTAVCILADSGRAYLSKLFEIQMSEADLEAYQEQQRTRQPRVATH